MDESRKNQGHLLAQQQALAEIAMAADALLSAALKHYIIAQLRISAAPMA